MVWQETPLPPGARLDAEQERELRLISQARAGADWALAALVARYQPMVVRYLVRLVGDSERARELAEKVFLRMERRLRGPHGGEYLRLWLLRASTESGLDALRHAKRGGQAARLDAPGASARLLSERVGVSTQRLREGLGKLAEKTSATGRQVRQLVWATDADPAQERPPDRWGAEAHRQRAAESAPLEDAEEPEEDAEDPRVELRHRMVRAVLAEIAYGDAQCLALHLVAGLNQAEVAHALGIRASAARHHIVLGLEMFAQRYEAALAALGIPAELAYADLDRSASAEPVRIEERASVEPAPRTIEATVTPLPMATPSDEHETANEMEYAADAEVSSEAPAPRGADIAADIAADVIVAATGAATGAAAIVEAREAETDIATSAPAESDAARGRRADTPAHEGASALTLHNDQGEPPFLVEPPLWQSPELADGALTSSTASHAGPLAGFAAPAQSVATIVADASATESATRAETGPREETLAAVAGVLAGSFIASPVTPPPIGPIVETAALAASPELPGLMAQDVPAPSEMALTYEVVELPSMPRAPIAVVPTLSPNRPPVVVPLLSNEQRGTPRAVPVLTMGETEWMPESERPRMVPVRTPTTRDAHGQEAAFHE